VPRQHGIFQVARHTHETNRRLEDYMVPSHVQRTLLPHDGMHRIPSVDQKSPSGHSAMLNELTSLVYSRFKDSIHTRIGQSGTVTTEDI
jgi:hypothetical protein